jgi:two-component system, NarL family, invasion response regulator UvrY
MFNILLVDDHSIVRTGLKILIDSHLPNCKIEEAFDGDSAFERIKRSSFDLVVMDVSMPNTDSLGIVSAMLAHSPSLKIIMFSMNPEEIYAKRYLKLGAKGYLGKDAHPLEIRRAIDMVLHNKRYISPELSEKLLSEMHDKRTTENPFDTLSTREFEIVQHLVQGTSSVDISKNLNLHVSTVATYKTRIFDKLKCRNIVDLCNLAKVYNVTVTA